MDLKVNRVKIFQFLKGYLLKHADVSQDINLVRITFTFGLLKKNTLYEVYINISIALHNVSISSHMFKYMRFEILNKFEIHLRSWRKRNKL